MSAWLLTVVSLLYFGAGIDAWIDGKLGLALFCAGCVIGNAGLVLIARS